MESIAVRYLLQDQIRYMYLSDIALIIVDNQLLKVYIVDIIAKMNLLIDDNELSLNKL